MKLDFQEIETFIHVVELGSVSLAAERLGISKSVVSKRLSDLEQRLNAKLLYRSTRKVTPTSNGSEFYQQSKAALADLRDAAETAAINESGLCGMLRITAPMSFGTLWLNRLIAQFMLQHPRIQVTLQLDDRVIDFEREGYDLCLRISRIRDSALIARQLAVSSRSLCCSPAYLAEHGAPSTVEEIGNHACIGYANVAPGQIWAFSPFDRPNDVINLAPQSRFISNNGEAMREMAEQGLGLTVLPTFLTYQQLNDGKLIALEPGARPTDDYIYAMYPRSSRSSRKVQALCDFLQQALHDMPWTKSDGRDQ
ncbi:LysR family transcriptional regulator [Pseudomonas sp. 5P_3.1_Bac2]|uniref:LysR family transcriptional regulator n=1 Tax=Pseudomonas sp. 5P_3.1_Bac2 TaxID=2971617 RepID=UPI0021C5E90C|nr:LysR family transcriptional regulator [Pseudomonas sp. 5P_3.1_Bac2]MCU1715761.1 LysR family transcriptional regulator [Pseudomonas sp. 5P_3.1_Bac2]